MKHYLFSFSYRNEMQGIAFICNTCVIICVSLLKINKIYNKKSIYR